MRHPQALGEEKFQLVAEALAPMAQVRALVRKSIGVGIFIIECRKELKNRTGLTLRRRDKNMAKHCFQPTRVYRRHRYVRPNLKERDEWPPRNRL